MEGIALLFGSRERLGGEGHRLVGRTPEPREQDDDACAIAPCGAEHNGCFGERTPGRSDLAAEQARPCPKSGRLRRCHRIRDARQDFGYLALVVLDLGKLATKEVTALEVEKSP